MSPSTTEFGTALRELVESASPEPAVHPAPERWLAYQHGELAPDEAAELAEHLVRCRDCFDLVQAAADLFGPAEASAADPDLASVAVWRQVQPRLQPARSRKRTWFPSALAASLLLALVGMTGWNLEQRRELAALRAPKPDAPIVDFSAGERLTTTGEVTLAAGSGPWVFVFHPAGEQPAYRLVIRDGATGREVSSHTLRLDTDFSLTLQLPVGLPAGRYRLEILDTASGSAGKVLQTHSLLVTRRGG